MTATAPRLSGIYIGLTAKERLAAELTAMHAGETPDRRLRDTMSEYQQAEFNRLIAVVNGLNGVVAWYALWLQARLEALDQRLLLLSVLWLWGETAFAIRLYRVVASTEPITESAFQQRREQVRNELFPVSELADELAWLDADANPGMSEKQLSARIRVRERELRQAIASKELAAEGKGRGFVRRGVFDDWRGEETVMQPEAPRGTRCFPMTRPTASSARTAGGSARITRCAWPRDSGKPTVPPPAGTSRDRAR